MELLVFNCLLFFSKLDNYSNFFFLELPKSWKWVNFNVSNFHHKKFMEEPIHSKVKKVCYGSHFIWKDLTIQKCKTFLMLTYAKWRSLIKLIVKFNFLLIKYCFRSFMFGRNSRWEARRWSFAVAPRQHPRRTRFVQNLEMGSDPNGPELTFDQE